MNLGHPVPLLITDEVRPLQVPPIPPIGTVDWPVEEPQLIALPDDWQLFFYTDGLIEGRLTPGSHERYGEKRLVEALQALACERIDGACMERLVSAIEVRAGEPFKDDVAAMLISKAEPPSQRHVADDRSTVWVGAQ
jgi:serine phosphatase RsbU (regulator of sigma subunit)